MGMSVTTAHFDDLLAAAARDDERTNQQRQDLETMSRISTLLRLLSIHVTVLRDVAASIQMNMDTLNESALDLRMGAMPWWYEEAAESSKGHLSSAVVGLEGLADRLEQVYLNG